MEGATCVLGFWHALKVRAWEPFHLNILPVPGGALQRTELGSQEHQEISAVLVRREMAPQHLIQTLWQSTEL